MALQRADADLDKCDHVNFILLGGGGGVVRLTAKPRYLLLLHRGKEKSNTVTALISAKQGLDWGVCLRPVQDSTEVVW